MCDNREVIRAIIFDCFGVLIGQGFDWTYRQAGGDPERDRDFIDDALHQANLGLIKDNQFHGAMAERLGLPIAHWHHVVQGVEQPNSELLDYITGLHRSYKTGILSNANRGVLDKKIGRKRLEDVFDAVVVSAEVGVAKPDIQMYKLALERLGVKPQECIYIDDKQSFVDAAQSIGMVGLRYEDTAQIKRDIDARLAMH